MRLRRLLGFAVLVVLAGAPAAVFAQFNEVPIISTSTGGIISGTYGYFKYISATFGGTAAADRITSGTTSMVAQTGGVISITTNGTDTGYFNSNGVLTLPGISATSNLTSVTTLYASGKVGVGIAAPTDVLHVYNNLAGGTGLSIENHNASNGAYARLLLINDAGSTAGLLFGSTGNASYMGPTGLAMGTFNSGALGLYTNNTLRLYISSTANLVGIGTSTPHATLDVVGTISASTAIQVGSNSLTCGTGISGTMRYSAISSTMEYCNGSAWTSMGPSDTTPVAFSVNKNGTNQTVTGSTESKLTWSTEVFDTNNNFAGDKFTPTVPGTYLITVSDYCPNSTTHCIAQIYKNGSVYSGKTSGGNSSGGNQGSQTTALVRMNGTTDYVEAYGENYSGTTISGDPTLTFFQGVLIGPQSAGAGGSTPAGSSNDVQFNSGGSLAADTGNFTYASSVLKAPTVSATNISGTVATINSLGAGNVNATGISVTTNQTSVTTLYASGKVGIGTASSTSTLSLAAGSGGFVQGINFLTGTNTSGYTLSVGVNDDGVNFSNNSSIRGFNFKNANGTLMMLTYGGILTVYGTSTCVIGSGSGATNCTSDRRLKKDITTIPNALEKLVQLKGVTFHWKDPKKSGPEHIGVIAQDVEKVFPQAVGEVSNTTLGIAKTVDIAALVAPMIEAVKELDTRSKQLKADNDDLRSSNVSLQRQVDKLGAAIESLQRQVHH